MSSPSRPAAPTLTTPHGNGTVLELGYLKILRSDPVHTTPRPFAPRDTTSYWRSSEPLPRFPRLRTSLRCDVVVIGGGVTGIMAALLLKRAGRRVCLLERRRCADIDTCQTSGHLTCAVDTMLSELVDVFGEDHARAVWDAGLAAIACIDDLVRSERIDCGFAWVPGYLHSPASRSADARDRERLRREASVAARLGFDVRYCESVPLFDRPGIQIEEQARFHPRRFLRALLERIDGDGSRVFEHSEVTEVTAAPLTVVASDQRVSCADVVVATHNPIVGRAGILDATLLQTALSLYTSYVVAGRAPKGAVPDALFWDTDDPYRYLRIDPRTGFDYVLLGGEDHKTGQANHPGARWSTLEKSLKSLGRVEPSHWWSGQVIETADGLPLMGYAAPHQYVATGFSGNGLTFGALGGMMACDAITGRSNPWRDLFDLHRTRVKGGVWDYLKENADYPYYLIRDRFAGVEGRSLRELPRRGGKVLELDGKYVAAYRDADGSVTLRSAVCTHMGCLVRWNAAEQSWDCPCHGSRFSRTGKVMSGPAEASLAEVPKP